MQSGIDRVNVSIEFTRNVDLKWTNLTNNFDVSFRFLTHMLPDLIYINFKYFSFYFTSYYHAHL